MIVGLGLDVIELRRIRASWERFGQRFAMRFLHPEELAAMPVKNPIPFLAGRFAAKEAGAKALGSGFRQAIHWHDLRIANNEAGAPFLTLYNGALERMEALDARSAYISITHGADTAAAVVILES